MDQRRCGAAPPVIAAVVALILAAALSAEVCGGLPSDGLGGGGCRPRPRVFVSAVRSRRRVGASFLSDYTAGVRPVPRTDDIWLRLCLGWPELPVDVIVWPGGVCVDLSVPV